MHVRTDDGDLSLSRDGVTFRPFALHGKQEAQTWPWSQVRHVTVEQGGKFFTPAAKALGVWAWLARSRKVMVVVSLPDGDMTFLTSQRLPELRSAALRLCEDVPEARVTVV